MRMFTSTLRRNACNCTFKDLQECLLYTFTGYISGDGCVLGFTCDLVDLIDVDDTVLRTFDIIICCLNDLQKNVLNIFANITCFGKCGCICDCERHIQKSGKCLRKQCLTGSCRSKHQNVAFL